jgi:hypothetical protein
MVFFFGLIFWAGIDLRLRAARLRRLMLGWRGEETLRWPDVMSRQMISIQRLRTANSALAVATQLQEVTTIE